MELLASRFPHKFYTKAFFRTQFGSRQYTLPVSIIDKYRYFSPLSGGQTV